MCGQIIGIWLPYVQLQLLRNLMNVLPVDTICSIEYCGEFAFLHVGSKWDIFVLTWQLLRTRFN